MHNCQWSHHILVVLEQLQPHDASGCAPRDGVEGCFPQRGGGAAVSNKPLLAMEEGVLGARKYFVLGNPLNSGL